MSSKLQLDMMVTSTFLFFLYISQDAVFKGDMICLDIPKISISCWLLWLVTVARHSGPEE